jgi:hypothetical protein
MCRAASAGSCPRAMGESSNSRSSTSSNLR